MTAGGSGRRRGRIALVGALAALAGAVALALVVEALNRGRAQREAFPPIEGSIAVPGLERPVVVSRDPRGIPHVEAVREADAYRALGFVHAEERLAQMVWLRRSAQGRLAEVVGPEALDADREARVLGIERHAEEAAAALPPRTRALLRAYVGGVNARIERIRAGEAAPPVVLQRLGVPLEEWREADSVALVKLYAWALAGHVDAGVVLQDLIETLGGFGARPFFPPGVGPDAGPPPADPLVTERRPPRAAPPPAGPVAAGALRTWSGLVGRSLGSSAFVVSGRHSKSGRPLLAADSHLPARAPSLFFQAHLRFEGGDVAGATIPGVPLFWTGHNGRVAWSAVHAGVTVTDLYIESLHPDGLHYHDGRQWRPFRTRTEVIRARGSSDASLDVRETAHGPLLTGLVAREREPLAMAWSGARKGDPLSALLGVSHAKDAAELRAALELHHEPVVLVVYADREGAAGLQMAGWVPQRSLPTGLVPVPGRNRWYGWSDAIPYVLLPHVELGSAGGFAVAADARLASPDDTVTIEWLWRTGRRSQRLHELLRAAVARGPLDLRAVTELQRDVVSGGVQPVVETALALAGPLDSLGQEERWVAEALLGWGGESTADSVGATVYHVFVRRVLDALLEPWIGREVARRYLGIPHVDPVFLARRLLAEPPDGGSGRAAEAVRKSLRETWIWLTVELGPSQDRWGWGRVHRLRFRPLWDDATGWDRRGLGPFPAPGDGTTVALAEYDPLDPFEVRVASTFRFAVDLAAPQEALTSLAPGQSGHPGHPNSVDGVARWLEGRPRLFATSPILVEEMAVARLVLEPAP